MTKHLALDDIDRFDAKQIECQMFSSWENIYKRRQDMSTLLSTKLAEDSMYQHMTIGIEEEHFDTSTTASKSAGKLFPSMNAFGLIYPNTARPELAVCPCHRSSEFSPHIFGVGYQGEAKSMTVETFTGICMYGSMSICESHVLSRSTKITDLNLFKHPLIGFCIMTIGLTSTFYVIEMIGKVFLRPFSNPFVTGSQAHHDAMEKINTFNEDYGARQRVFERGLSTDVNVDKCDILGDDVFWTREPVVSEEGKWFYKYIKAKARFVGHGAFFRHLYRVYTTYQERRPWEPKEGDGDDIVEGREGLVDAQLLFGHLFVCVKMKWVDGVRFQIFEEFKVHEKSVLTILKALYFSGFIHTDARLHNIMMEEGHDQPLLHVIDYDDMIVFNPKRATSDGWNILEGQYCAFWDPEKKFTHMTVSNLMPGVVSEPNLINEMDSLSVND
jgi:hypothetical protein